MPELPSSVASSHRLSLPTHPFARRPHPVASVLPRDTHDDATSTADRLERLVLLRPAWSPADIPAAAEPSPVPPTVVLFVGQDRALDIAAALQAVPGARWVLVREDFGMPRITRDEYVLADDDEEAAVGLERLLADHQVDAVVDLTSLDDGSGAGALGKAFGDHLLELAGRRLQVSPSSRFGMLMVGYRTWMRPVHARHAAVVRALGAEYDNVSAACLDLTDPPDDVAALLNLVLDELRHMDRHDPKWTVLDKSKRLDRSLEEVALPATGLAPGRFGPFAIDSNNIYVITGGRADSGWASLGG